MESIAGYVAPMVIGAVMRGNPQAGDSEASVGAAMAKLQAC